MGQLGFQELAVIFLIALLVFGPKKLPELGKSLGKGIREFKRATNDLKSSWDEQVRESELAEAAKDLRTFQKDIDREMRTPDRPVAASGTTDASLSAEGGTGPSSTEAPSQPM